MSLTLKANPTQTCSVQLSNKDRWVRISMWLGISYQGGTLVTPSNDFHFSVEGADDLSGEYRLSNWLSGITSGALYAFRSLKVQHRCVFLTELSGKLGSTDMTAVANAAAIAIALCSGRNAPACDLAGWTVHSESQENTNGSSGDTQLMVG